MLFSIIIVNYNVCSETEICINSIIKKIENDFEIIVIDNNSPDRSIELLAQKFPQIKFYFLKENIGFAKANNFGVEKSSGDFLLFLNPDTIILKEIVSPMIEYFYQNENVGAIGPMLINTDGSFQGSTSIRLGYIYEFCEAFFFMTLLRFVYNIFLKIKITNKTIIPVRWVSAACLFISKDVFNDVAGFNSEFFLNYEDIDLCQRIENAGYKNYYFNSLKCVHIEHASQRDNYKQFVLYRYKSRLIYGRYHYGPVKRFIIKLFHITGLLLRIIFVKILYKGKEKIERGFGYKEALKIYLNAK